MSTRLIYLFGFVITSLLILTGYYLEIFGGFMPCPLCSLERIAFIILAILFLGGFLSRPKRSAIVFNISLLLTSLFGCALTARQIWLQHFPPKNVGECSVNLMYLLKTFSLTEVIQRVYEGGIDCAERGFEFMSLNMAEWALLWFGLFFILSLWLLIKKQKTQ
jgi:disulfide bond formation protein DsbB